MNRLLVILVLFNSYLIQAQTRSSVIFNAGVVHYHQVDKEAPDLNPRGMRATASIVGYRHFGNYFALGIGAGAKSSPSGGIPCFIGNARVTILRNTLTGFSSFLEGGIEICDYGDSYTPLFWGTRQVFCGGNALVFRVKLPSFFDTHYFRIADHYEWGIDLGLQFQISRLVPKSVTRSGNPFILL